MKKDILLLFLSATLLLSSVNAQKLQIGLTATPWGVNDIHRPLVMDDAGYLGNGFYAIGISCQIPIVSHLDVETGIEYSRHIITTNYINPSSPIPQYKSKVKLVSIPVTLNLNFLKYFFVNGGGLLDIDASSSSRVDDQTGIGALLGIGGKYDFNFGGTVFINPYFAYHSLLPFSPSRYQQRISEDGIRIGFMYNLSKNKSSRK
jgi:hypothetical protein